ncbi:NACHT domain-containing protein [Nonomuraea insulae]|uniref:NACHT domain-containing protein n=1 Tax=Nonomuraea insulae TaxID=1616787 RepID=A0ABW1D5P2_9ACTN
MTALSIPLGEKVIEQGVAACGLVCSLAALVVGLIGLTPKAPLATERLAGAANDLAKAVKEQWQAEWLLRRLQDPWPMRVRWDAADPLLSDHEGNVGCDRLDGEFDGIATLFRRLPGGRLVVLGGPGAGKSVLALRLTLDLLKERGDGEPVPVLFSLSTWHPQQCHLHEWMAHRLALDHGTLAAQARPGVTIARELLADGRILPVLDGLDEIPPPLRREALRRLNSEIDAGAPVLLTCRTEAYSEIARDCDVFTAAAVIELRSLTLDELARYLNGTSRRGAPPGATKWREVLKLLADQPQKPIAQSLSTMLSVPLMAAMARAIYSDTAAHPGDLLDSRFAEPAVLEAHLLDAYIPATFAPAPGPPGTAAPRWTIAQVTRWLGFLAVQSERRGRRAIAWWELPQALPCTVRLLPFGLLACVAILGAWCVFYRFQEVSWSVVAVTLYMIALGVGLRTQPNIRAALLAGALSGILIGITQDLNTASIDITLGGPGPMLTVLPLRPNERYFANMAVYGLATALLLGAAGIGRRPRPLTIPLRLSRGGHVPADKPAQVLDLIRSATRGLTRGMLGGVGIGLISGLCCGTAAGLRAQDLFAAVFMREVKLWVSGGLILGLVSGLLGALYRCSERSADTAAAPSPLSSLRADRHAAFGRALLGLLFMWPLLLLAEALGRLGMIDNGRDLVILLLVPLGPLVILLAAWGRLLAARLWLCGLGRLPWRLMTFLTEAHKRGVLRQAGAAYEFRHIRLQERLACLDQPPVSPPSRPAWPGTTSPPAISSATTSDSSCGSTPTPIAQPTDPLSQPGSPPRR